LRVEVTEELAEERLAEMLEELREQIEEIEGGDDRIAGGGKGDQDSGKVEGGEVCEVC
jgi:hypothetical protein